MKLKMFFVLFLFGVVSQAQTIAPAPEDKAVVYFVRPSGTGLFVTFSYFDKDQFIGHFAGRRYIRYECDPGQHLFWAFSENKDFIKANIEAGKIYIIEAKPQMGALVARVKLELVSSPDYKMKKIRKLLSKKEPLEFSEEDIEYFQKQYERTIEKGMKKAQKIDEKIRIIDGLPFHPEDLVYKKK